MLKSACKTSAMESYWLCLTNISDLPSFELEEIKHFFQVYKSLEPNKAVHGGDWVDHKAAEDEINASYKRYKKQ